MAPKYVDDFFSPLGQKRTQSEISSSSLFVFFFQIGAIISGYCFSSAGDEAALKRLVAQNGPVSVAVDTNSPSFRFYKEGIYEDSNCENSPEAINHAVLIVGYGTLNGKDYWLVKNSWGILWGIHGYMMLSRNANNLCGIATRPLLPLI